MAPGPGQLGLIDLGEGTGGLSTQYEVTHRPNGRVGEKGVL